MDIVLSSDVYKIIDIKGKAKSDTFRDVKVGDLLKFSTSIEHKGGASNGLYASYIKTYNTTQGTYSVNSQSVLVNTLRKWFVLEKVN